MHKMKQKLPILNTTAFLPKHSAGKSIASCNTVFFALTSVLFNRNFMLFGQKTFDGLGLITETRQHDTKQICCHWLPCSYLYVMACTCLDLMLAMLFVGSDLVKPV